MNLKIIFLKFLSNLSGANELIAMSWGVIMMKDTDPSYFGPLLTGLCSTEIQQDCCFQKTLPSSL